MFKKLVLKVSNNSEKVVFKKALFSRYVYFLYSTWKGESAFQTKVLKEFVKILLLWKPSKDLK